MDKLIWHHLNIIIWYTESTKGRIWRANIILKLVLKKENVTFVTPVCAKAMEKSPHYFVKN